MVGSVFTLSKYTHTKFCGSAYETFSLEMKFLFAWFYVSELPAALSLCFGTNKLTKTAINRKEVKADTMAEQCAKWIYVRRRIFENQNLKEIILHLERERYKQINSTAKFCFFTVLPAAATYILQMQILLCCILRTHQIYFCVFGVFAQYFYEYFGEISSHKQKKKTFLFVILRKFLFLFDF